MFTLAYLYLKCMWLGSVWCECYKDLGPRSEVFWKYDRNGKLYLRIISRDYLSNYPGKPPAEKCFEK